MKKNKLDNTYYHTMANEDMIIGLKSNCKKGYAMAEFWQKSYEKSLVLTLKAWRLIEDIEQVNPIAWETVSHYSHYKTIDSERIGLYSKIEGMIIPEKTYTNKKGVTKTTPEEKVPSHYTQGGEYIGRVSTLGDKPISYKMELLITPHHFDFVRVGATLEECFELKQKLQGLAGVKTKKVPKSILKAK
jgi:hypothetical protein